MGQTYVLLSATSAAATADAVAVADVAAANNDADGNANVVHLKLACEGAAPTPAPTPTLLFLCALNRFGEPAAKDQAAGAEVQFKKYFKGNCGIEVRQQYVHAEHQGPRLNSSLCFVGVCRTCA
jgi:hypothetical protein